MMTKIASAVAAIVPGLAAAFVGFLANPLAAQTAARGLTPERQLWGHWQALDGKFALQIKDDRTAILESAGEKPDDPPLPHFGTIAVKQGAWMLSVADPQGRSSTFGIAVKDGRRIVLADGSDEVREFVRCDVPFDVLDRNADGVLTPEEVRGSRLFRLFDNCDVNLDRKLDRSEYAIYWAKYAP